MAGLSDAKKWNTNTEENQAESRRKRKKTQRQRVRERSDRDHVYMVHLQKWRAQIMFFLLRTKGNINQTVALYTFKKWLNCFCRLTISVSQASPAAVGICPQKSNPPAPNDCGLQ